MRGWDLLCFVGDESGIYASPLYNFLFRVVSTWGPKGKAKMNYVMPILLNPDYSFM